MKKIQFLVITATFKALMSSQHAISCLKIFETSIMVTRGPKSLNFPDIQAIRKLSRLSKNFPDHPENIQIIRKLTGPSGKYSDYLEILQTVHKLPSTFLRVTRKNFPDARKLSGWQCHDATMVFGPLMEGL